MYGHTYVSGGTCMDTHSRGGTCMDTHMLVVVHVWTHLAVGVHVQEGDPAHREVIPPTGR